MAQILAANGSAVFTNGCVINSRRFGVVMFTYPRAGQLRIDHETVFNTASTAIQIKGTGATVVLDESTLNPGNGILVQAMIDDNDRQPGRPKPGEPPREFAADPDVRISFSNTKLTGDVINSRTQQGNLILDVEGVTLTGRVSSAVQSPAEGVPPTEERLRLIGEVTNSFGPGPGPFGTTFQIDEVSRWIVTGPSYLTGLILLPGARILNEAGEPATVTVDGKPVPANKPGSYLGAIVVTP